MITGALEPFLGTVPAAGLGFITPKLFKRSVDLIPTRRRFGSRCVVSISMLQRQGQRVRRDLQGQQDKTTTYPPQLTGPAAASRLLPVLHLGSWLPLASAAPGRDGRFGSRRGGRGGRIGKPWAYEAIAQARHMAGQPLSPQNPTVPAWAMQHSPQPSDPCARPR